MKSRFIIILTAFLTCTGFSDSNLSDTSVRNILKELQTASEQQNYALLYDFVNKYFYETSKVTIESEQYLTKDKKSKVKTNNEYNKTQYLQYLTGMSTQDVTRKDIKYSMDISSISITPDNKAATVITKENLEMIVTAKDEGGTDYDVNAKTASSCSISFYDYVPAPVITGMYCRNSTINTKPKKE